jgi:hypothetical protein
MPAGPVRWTVASVGLAPAADALPAGLDVMSVGEFEPEAWVPAAHPAAAGAAIGP